MNLICECPTCGEKIEVDYMVDCQTIYCPSCGTILEYDEYHGELVSE